MRKNVWVVLLIAGVVLTAGVSAEAKDSRYGHGHGGYAGKVVYKAHKLLKYSDELGLSEDQINRIKAIKIEAKKAMIQKEADVQLIGLDIRVALKEDKIDTAAVQKLIDRKYEIKKAAAKKAAQSLADLKGLLTDEQRASLKALKKKWHEGSHG